MYTDAPRGIAHVVLVFVSLGFLTHGILFVARYPNSVHFFFLSLTPLEFLIALGSALIGFLAYWLRRRQDRQSSTVQSRRVLAISKRLQKRSSFIRDQAVAKLP
jgi:hypothetical protein